MAATAGSPSSPRRLIAVVAGLLAVFAALAVAAAWHHRPLLGDSALNADLLGRHGQFWWRVADAVTFVASGPVVAVIAFAAAAWLALARRRFVAALAVVAAPAVAGVAEAVLKTLIARPRPLTASLTGESGNGFPSGHVTGFSALAVTLLVVLVLTVAAHRRPVRLAWTAVTALAVVLVMWSRVAVGAHWASDTVAGAVLGTAVGLATLPVVTWVVPRLPLDRLPLVRR